MKENLKRLFDYRELLFNLTRKEVKVKYKNSFLGFLWSLVNPLMMLAVYYVAFGIIFKLRALGMTHYEFYLMAGILPWNFLAITLMSSVGSVVMSGDMVKKVYFPREVLPLSHLGSATFHFLLQEMVLIVFLLVFRIKLSPWILAMPLLTILQMCFIAGFSLLFSALNVFFRDVQHFTEILLLAWFWMTPIVYPVSFIRDAFPHWAFGIYMLNPMAHMSFLWQQITYNSPVNGPEAYYFSWSGFIYVIFFSLAMLVVGYYVFCKVEGRFAEFI
ncbi:MAG: ABC transporter permease [Actinomycetota bacterium]|nr:ABC transporter permease [Actinomycetota bacterium]